jgi:hypothetical protein
MQTMKQKHLTFFALMIHCIGVKQASLTACGASRFGGLHL